MRRQTHRQRLTLSVEYGTPRGRANDVPGESPSLELLRLIGVAELSHHLVVPHPLSHTPLYGLASVEDNAVTQRETPRLVQTGGGHAAQRLAAAGGPLFARRVPYN